MTSPSARTRTRRPGRTHVAALAVSALIGAAAAATASGGPALADDDTVTASGDANPAGPAAGTVMVEEIVVEMFQVRVSEWLMCVIDYDGDSLME